MSEGSYTPWPEHINYAVSKLGYEDPYDEITVEQLRNRLGSLAFETFVDVLQEGSPEDILFALFAVGSRDTPQTRQLLVPFLQSTRPQERWASALCLGEMKDEAALPVLCSMLTEFLPPYEQVTSQRSFQWLYDYWRPTVVRLLGEWKRKSLVPVFYAALQELWGQEQSLPTLKLLSRRSWQHCQDRLVYALGQVDAFHQVKEVEASEERQCLWRVYASLGYLQALERHPDIFKRGLRDQPALQEQVAKILGQKFGLSKEEQTLCLQMFREERLNR